MRVLRTSIDVGSYTFKAGTPEIIVKKYVPHAETSSFDWYQLTLDELQILRNEVFRAGSTSAAPSSNA